MLININMKAIKVTQTLKDQNKFLETRTVGSWYIGNLPNVFVVGNDAIHGYKGRFNLQLEHGWKDFIQPITTTNQKVVQTIIESATTITYQVIDLSEAEIIQNLKNNIESQREQAIQDKIKATIINDAQAIVDDAEAFNNSIIYPFWESGIEVKLNDKYQFFVGTELQLFKVVQAHTTQDIWTPPTVPALFTRIAPAGIIPDFIQPTGAQDAYAIGDQVRFEGQVWESIINSNVWSPTEYPQGWSLID